MPYSLNILRSNLVVDHLALISTNITTGVTAIIHTASPISHSNTTWDDAITPAIQGTVGILKSANNHAGPKLESFVLTSSVAAVQDPSKTTHRFTEADWNEWAVGKAKTGDTRALYAASKTLAERAIWEFRDEKKVPSFFFKTPSSRAFDKLIFSLSLNSPFRPCYPVSSWVLRFSRPQTPTT